MSLDFHLFLNAEETATSLQMRFADWLGLELAPDFKGLKKLLSPSLNMVIGPDLSDSARAAGIVANLGLGLYLRDRSLLEEWNIDCMRVLLTVLHNYPGDVLFVELENPALLRKNGRIVLDNKHGTWNDDVEPNLRAMLNLPYEFGEIKMNW